MSRYEPIEAEVLDAIAAAGFDVYQAANPRSRTFLIFTDGTRIGYLQRGDYGGLSLSTVHIPNRITGTSFGMSEGGDPPVTLTREGLERAFAHAPGWATPDMRASVKKWPDMAAFLKAETILKYERVRDGVGLGGASND